MNKQKQIKIITRHAIVNHGSLLQSIASIEFFNNLGYSSQIIDYVRRDETYPEITKTFLSQNPQWNRFGKRFLYKIIKGPSFFVGQKKFRKYRKELLPLSKPYDDITITDKFEADNGTIICAGSDQLWGPVVSGKLDTNYFLGFAKGYKKISFSSSIGRNVQIDDDILRLLNEFDLITVREKSAKNLLIASGVNCEPLTIMDPTMLVSPNYWNDRASDVINEDYILVYKLHKSADFDKYILNFAKEKKLKIRRIINSFDDYFGEGKKEFLIHPYRFLSLIKNAKYIITDSFHCVQFSVIFKKEFLVKVPDKTGSRIIDFLNMFGLKKRIIDFNSENDIDDNINYDLVHEKISIERMNEIDRIKEILGGLNNE